MAILYLRGMKLTYFVRRWWRFPSLYCYLCHPHHFHYYHYRRPMVYQQENRRDQTSCYLRTSEAPVCNHHRLSHAPFNPCARQEKMMRETHSSIIDSPVSLEAGITNDQIEMTIAMPSPRRASVIVVSPL